MKNKLLLFFLCWLGAMGLRAQEPSPGGFTTPDGIFDQVFDRFGNKYNLNDIRIYTEPANKKTDLYKEQSGMAPVHLLCTAGYFNVYFEDGSGFELSTPTQLARRAVICQLFTDLSNFIVPVNPLNKVNIWVRDINYIVPSAVSSGVLGLATAFYTLPAVSPASSGIVDGEIWHTINSGKDGYTSVSSPLITSGSTPSGAYYHGMMAFNFDNPGITWHTNLSAATGSSDYDLYTVALHEMTHALGFASLIDYNGLSKFGTSYNFFSRYDLFLKTQTAQNLITNTGTCSMYDYTFNPSLTASTLLSPNPATCGSVIPYSGSLDNTVCSTAVNFAGTVNQAVYTPDCFEPPSSLSHLEEQCHLSSPYPNNQYYCMSNANGTGSVYMKRYLKPEERNVLCDIGYKINGYYGNTLFPSNNYTYGATCPGLDVAGVHDGISSTATYVWVTTTSSTVNLSGAVILGNDHNASSFECLQVINGLGSVSTTLGTTSTTVVFSAGASAGVALLRYIPVSGTGNRGNITYILVRINSPACAASPCNMIPNGGFENGANCGQPGPPDNPYINCWSVLGFSPDYYVRGCVPPSGPDYTIPTGPFTCVPASDTWSGPSTGNDKFLGMWHYISGGSFSYYLIEGEQVMLSSPIMPNVPYTLSFWAKSANGSWWSGSNDIMFRGDVTTGTPMAWNAPFTAGQYLTHADVPADYQWHYYSLTFTYTGTTPLYNFMMGNVGNGGGYLGSYVFVDDFTLTPSSLTATFTPPAALCGGTISIPNLADYVFPAPTAGSSFSGPGVSAGPVYSFTMAAPGTYTVLYHYVNALGCTITIPAQIKVTSASGPSVSISASPSGGVCSGTPVTLTASGAPTYTWYPPQPCTTPCSTVTVTATSTYTYMAIGTDTAGCVDTAQVTVTVIPCAVNNHTMTYEMPDDVKHYTTKLVPQSMDESVMAGTIFHSTSGGTNSLHFMRLDAVGNILVSQEYTSPYQDERVVDVEPQMVGPMVYWYMVCLSRFGTQDFIKVVVVDNNGILVNQRVYKAPPGFALYPMHSTTWMDPTGANRLYICGYATTGPLVPFPATPDYTTPKQAFVFGIDINPGLGYLNPVHSTLYDWIWPAATPASPFDYDIAMRIVVVQPTNQLFITGSVNGLQTTLLCATCVKAPDRSATMNLVVDPMTATLNVVSDNPFMQYNSADDFSGPQDYGVDLIQVNGGYYILGNKGDIQSTFWHPTPPAEMYPRESKIFYVQTLAGLSFVPIQRWSFQNVWNHWAAHAITTSPTTATIATLISNQYQTCIPLPNTPSYDNVDVDLVTVDFTTYPPSTYTIGPNRIYLTSTGTGDPSVSPNAFYDLGDGLSLMDVSPTFAAMGANQYMVNAPKYMSGKLNLKFINPDLGFNISCGPTWDANLPACQLASPFSYLAQDAFIPASTTVVPHPIGITVHPGGFLSTGLPYTIPAPAPCVDLGGGPSYKNGLLNTDKADAGKTKLYPNPTDGRITIDLASNIAAGSKIKVRMENVLGQDMGNVFNGTAANKVEIKLPSVKPGVYMVEVYANDNLILKQKLMIQ